MCVSLLTLRKISAAEPPKKIFSVWTELDAHPKFVENSRYVLDKAKNGLLWPKR